MKISKPFLQSGMIKIFFKGEEEEIVQESSAMDLAVQKKLTEPHLAVGVLINGTPKDPSTPLKEGDQIEFISFDDLLGKEIFWHTSAHVLAQAILRLYPSALPTIGPPLEEGFYYDFANLEISIEDFPKIEQEIKNILKENYKSEKTQFTSKKEAIEHFKKNKYKVEIIEEIPENIPLTAYKQGEFFDLCRGPHLYSLGKIKAFKLTKVSGAYWRADKNNTMLTRIYGISFPNKEGLKEYLFQKEEARKRDHRVLGPKLDLFSMKEYAPGMPFFHPHGMRIWSALIDFWNKAHQQHGYLHIKTPQILSRELWELSGHWEHYRENMYITEIDERFFAIKPMNCPGCMLYFKGTKHSYRELPLRIGEIGHVHRHEFSGALSGLFRVRSFHQDDAHIFMTKDQIKSEILALLHLTDQIYSAFGLDYFLELSTRPQKSIGSDENWEITTQALKSALDDWGKEYKINEGDGAFYGPKIDLHIKDVLKRKWQCGTIQLDMSLPKQFELTFIDEENKEVTPFMLHRAIFGSIERFLGILIEHFAGRFPLWLSPRQIRVLTVADRHIDHAKKLQHMFEEAGFFCDVDTSHETMNKKVRNAQLLQINYILTVGDKEIEEDLISCRERESNKVFSENPKTFMQKLVLEKNQKKLKSIYE
jgi:threonyl-tRNA synthetase